MTQRLPATSSSRRRAWRAWRIRELLAPRRWSAGLRPGAIPPVTHAPGRRPALHRWLANAPLRAFTLTDLLVLIAALSVVGAMVTGRLVAAREKSRLAVCTANLQKVDRAVLDFCPDHNQTLPSAIPDEKLAPWWFYKEQVKHYVGLTGESSASDAVFACPSDRGYSDPLPFHLNRRFDFSSYVFNGITLPGMPNIAGLPLAEVKQPKRTLLVMEWTAHAPLSWHASKTGKENSPFYCDARSVVGFVDGHVSFSKIYYDGYNAAYTQDPIDGYEYQYSGN